MYYLLCDNMIVSGDKVYEDRDTIGILQDNYNKDVTPDNRLPIFKDFIQRQSEKLVDLIDCGDLIRYKDDVYQVDEFKEFYILDFSVSVDWEINNINTIFKLNKEGNYIKVWERYKLCTI